MNSPCKHGVWRNVNHCYACESERRNFIMNNGIKKCDKHNWYYPVNEVCQHCLRLEERLKILRDLAITQSKLLAPLDLDPKWMKVPVDGWKGKDELTESLPPIKIEYHGEPVDGCEDSGHALDSLNYSVSPPPTVDSPELEGDFILRTRGKERYEAFKENLIQSSRFYEAPKEEKPYEYDPDFDDP